MAPCDWGQAVGMIVVAAGAFLCLAIFMLGVFFGPDIGYRIRGDGRRGR